MVIMLHFNDFYEHLKPFYHFLRAGMFGRFIEWLFINSRYDIFYFFNTFSGCYDECDMHITYIAYLSEIT